MCTYFAALLALPYAATEGLSQLLECLSEHGGFAKHQWKAQTLKMGLFFVNLRSRMVWIWLHESILYTFETICKFRKPIDKAFDIYCLNVQSFERGPTTDADANEQPYLAYRDRPYIKHQDWARQYTSEGPYKRNEIWQKVLTYWHQDLPPNDFKQTFEKYAKAAY